MFENVFHPTILYFVFDLMLNKIPATVVKRVGGMFVTRMC